jgi:hypothetical protein
MLGERRLPVDRLRKRSVVVRLVYWLESAVHVCTYKASLQLYIVLINLIYRYLMLNIFTGQYSGIMIR